MAWQRATGGHHWRVDAAHWNVAKVNDVQLMFCIQTCALDSFDKQEAWAKGTDYFRSLRAAHASTRNTNDAPGVPKP